MITPLTKSKEKLDGKINESFANMEGKTSIGKITPEKAAHPIRKNRANKSSPLINYNN